MSSFDFAGKAVCVTGAAHGIGAALARALAAAGARLLLVDLDAAALESLAAELRAQGVELLTARVDLRDAQAVARLPQLAEQELGGLHGLINVAGILVAGALEHLDAERAACLLDVNLRGAVLATRACVPLLRRQPASFICSVSSVSWLLASAHNALYDASKAGLFCFSRTLRGELRRAGVRVSVVLPWLVQTPMLDDAQALAALGLDRRMLRWLPVDRADSVARATLQGIAADRFAILPGPAARTLWALHRLHPQLPGLLGHAARALTPRQALRMLGECYGLLHRLPWLGEALVRRTSHGLGLAMAHSPLACPAEAGSLEPARRTLETFTRVAGIEVRIAAGRDGAIALEVPVCPYGFERADQAALCDAAMDMDRTLFARCGAQLHIEERLVAGAASCRMLLRHPPQETVL